MYKLRLSRVGVRNSPLYQIVVANARSARDKKHLEKVGYYDPKPDNNKIKQIGLNFERVKYWISLGAQPTDTVQKILAKAGLLPHKYPTHYPKNEEIKK